MRLFAVLLVAMVTCAFAPNGIERMDPPKHYREIYDSAVACSKAYQRHRPKPYSEVRWYMVPGKEFKCENGTKCIGHTEWPHSITIAEEWLTTDWVVKHELIHYVTGRPHFLNDQELWGRACHATWGWLVTDSTYKP